jgi:hypothetical protein
MGKPAEKGGRAEIFQSSKNRTLQVLSKRIRLGAASSGKGCASPEQRNSHGWQCWGSQFATLEIAHRLESVV